MIVPPTNCPSCSSILERSNDQLYCKNSSCPAKSYKQIEHFAKTLKIKGLGPAAIEKLDIISINDIYEIDIEFLKLQLGSEKIAVKLFNEIEKSKQEPLNTVLPAFGIPLVGNSATSKLSTVIVSIFDINTATCKEAGLGNVATKNLMDWIEQDFDKYVNLPFSFEFELTRSSVSEDAPIVCISGKLKSYSTKAAAKAALEAKGYRVKDTLTKDVSILVNESGVESAKTIKAANDGVRIINNLKDLIGE